MTRQRKQLIKKRLKDFNSSKELIPIYSELISRYKEIGTYAALDQYQLDELKEWEIYRLDLFKKVEVLEKGVELLNRKEDEMVKEIVEYTYIFGYSRTKIMHLTNYSEQRIKQILEVGYMRLNRFVI